MADFRPVFKTLGVLICSLAMQTALPAGAQERIASTSLCADSYVLALAAHDNIHALSWQAADKVAGTPDVRRGLPKAWDEPERLLALSPDLVVFGPGEGKNAKPFLDRAAISHVTLNWGEDFQAVKANESLLASILGRANAHSPPPMAPATGIRVLYLSRDGSTAGPDTFVDAAIRAAGGVNSVTRPGWRPYEPEYIAGLAPDLIITSFMESGYDSVNAAGKTQSLIADKLAAAPYINIPGRLWPCAGPGLYAARDRIANAIKDIVP